MSFKAKVTFKFRDGQDVEFSTLPDGFDKQYIANLENAIKNNGTIHLGHPGNEIQKKAKDLISLEVFF